jgi:hypothetical protein
MAEHDSLSAAGFQQLMMTNGPQIERDRTQFQSARDKIGGCGGSLFMRR